MYHFNTLGMHIIIPISKYHESELHCIIINTDSTVADIQRLMKTDEAAICRQSALFLLKMKEKRFLSQAAVDDIVEDSCANFYTNIRDGESGSKREIG